MAKTISDKRAKGPGGAASSFVSRVMRRGSAAPDQTVAAQAKPEKRSASRSATRPSAAAPRERRSLRRFLREVRVEMSKVTWPPRAELIQSTAVVIVAVVIAAIYIGVFDFIWSSLVQLVRLG